MNIRRSCLATGGLMVAAFLLLTGRSSAVFYGLGPSDDEWGLKYDVQVNPAAGDKLNVVFTLADEGRLKPVYSYTVIAFSKQTDSYGGRTYDVKAPIKLKTIKDGRRAGQVQIGKELVDRAMIRILTLSVDGRRRPTNGAAYYDIPISKFVNKVPVVASPPAQPAIAAPPVTNVTK